MPGNTMRNMGSRNMGLHVGQTASSQTPLDYHLWEDPRGHDL